MTQAVIFDLDGTLTDTELIWDEVRHQLAAEDGLVWPESGSHAIAGMSTAEWSAYMSDVVGIGPTPEIAARRTFVALTPGRDGRLHSGQLEAAASAAFWCRTAT